MALGTLTIDLKANTAKLERDLGKANRLAERSVDKNERRLRKFKNTVRGIAGGMVIAGAAIVGIFKNSATELDLLIKTSDKLGILPERLAGIQHAGELTGVSLETTNMALQRFTRRVAEAAAGTGEAVSALAELGVDARELQQLPLEQQFAAIADQMLKVETQSDRVRLSMKLFDSEGVALVNTLGLGSDGLAEMQKEAEELGIALGRADLLKVEEANDAFTRARAAGTGLANVFTVQLAPAMETIADWMASMASKGGLVETTFGVIQFAAEELARVQFGTAANDLVRLREDLKGVQDEIAIIEASRAGGNIPGKRDDTGAERRRALRLQQLEDERLKIQALIDLRTDVSRPEPPPRAIGIGSGDDGLGFAQAEALKKQADSYNLSLIKRAELINDTTAVTAALFEIEQGRFQDIETAQQAEIVFSANRVDMLEAEKAKTEELKKAEEERLKKLETVNEELMKGVQASIKEFLFDPFDEGIEGMLKGFGRMLQQMALEAAAAKLTEKLFSSFGGGDDAGGIAKLFAGFFDGGGNIPAGQFGVVAENRAELVSRGGKDVLVPGPAKVLGGAQTAAMMGSNVHINVTNNAEAIVRQGNVSRSGDRIDVEVIIDAVRQGISESLLDDELSQSFGLSRSHGLRG